VTPDQIGRAHRARTVFLGSGAFAVPIFGAVATHPALELVGVVSAPDRPAGRGQRTRQVPVAALARDRGWLLLQPERLRAADARAAVLDLRPDLLVLADYGQIVPASLLEASQRGALNVHPSLLPRHRGASPIASTILAGDEESGVTVILMDAGVDSGPIVAQERLVLSGEETTPVLEERLAALGARLLAGVLGPWVAGTIEPRPQPSAGITLTRPLLREDGRLAWTRPAAEIERQVRAYQPWPGSFTGSPAGTIVIWAAHAIPAEGPDMEAMGGGAGRQLPPGTVVARDRGLAVATGSGLLELLDVQLAGRRRMSGRELRNGYPGLVGQRLDEGAG
jgi:methionyl-tRNA formyltransferase